MDKGIVLGPRNRNPIKFSGFIILKELNMIIETSIILLCKGSFKFKIPIAFQAQ